MRGNSERVQSKAMRRSRRKEPAWTGPRASWSPRATCTRMGATPRSLGSRESAPRERERCHGSSKWKIPEGATIVRVAPGREDAWLAGLKGGLFPGGQIGGVALDLHAVERNQILLHIFTGGDEIQQVQRGDAA